MIPRIRDRLKIRDFRHANFFGTAWLIFELRENRCVNCIEPWERTCKRALASPSNQWKDNDRLPESQHVGSVRH
jgi:hypothetical protein